MYIYISLEFKNTIKDNSVSTLLVSAKNIFVILSKKTLGRCAKDCEFVPLSPKSCYILTLGQLILGLYNSVMFAYILSTNACPIEN